MRAFGGLHAVLAVLVGAVATSASAQSTEEPADAGSVYVKAGVGAVFLRDLDQNLAFNPNAVVVGPTPLPFSRRTDPDNGFTAAAAIGFAYAAGTRTELEYRYSAPSILGITETSLLDQSDVAPTGDLTTHVLMSNVYYDFKNTSRITPFIGVGVGGVFVSNGLGENDAAFAYQGKIGFETTLSRNVALGVEYAYTRSRDLVFGPDDDDFVDGGPFGPRADGDEYVTSTVLATIRKTF